MIPLAALCLAFAPAPFLAARKPATLEGTWEMLSHLRQGGGSALIGKEGLRIDKNGRWTFTRDGRDNTRYDTRRDDKARPPTLDLLNPGSRPDQPASFVGIYRMEGDILLYSYLPGGRPDAPRPAGFEPTGPSQYTIRLRRVPEAKR
ncbi:MAG: hypothetical protein K2W96_05995 [Gemmataceae bacterium]|nr:hypothetical protein [Gemmataceae bacterium]